MFARRDARVSPRVLIIFSYCYTRKNGNDDRVMRVTGVGMMGEMKINSMRLMLCLSSNRRVGRGDGHLAPIVFTISQSIHCSVRNDPTILTLHFICGSF